MKLRHYLLCGLGELALIAALLAYAPGVLASSSHCSRFAIRTNGSYVSRDIRKAAGGVFVHPRQRH